MNSRRAIFGVTVLVASGVGFGMQQGTKSREVAAVERAVLDYCEAFYEVKPEYLERSVHPDLHKFGFARRSPNEAYRKIPMNYSQLIELSKRWNKDGTKAKGAPKKVEVFDVLDQIACAKLTAAWGIDYLMLAKYEGKWKIEQVMWQIHPQVSGD